MNTTSNSINTATAAFTAPKPTFKILDNKGSKTGQIRNDNVTDDATPLLSGKGTPGSTITLYNHGKAMATVTVNSKGNWTYAPTLDDGNYSISIAVTDSAHGRSLSPTSSTMNFTVQTKEPVFVEKPTFTFNDDNGDEIEAGQETATRQPYLSGEGNVGHTIVITLNGKTYECPVEADENGNGTWELVLSEEDALADGTYTMSIKALDEKGNPSATETIDFTVAEPVVVVEPVPTTLNIDGIFNSTDEMIPTGVYTIGKHFQWDSSLAFAISVLGENATADSTPTARGTATPGATVTITVTNGSTFASVQTLTVQADPITGQWSQTLLEGMNLQGIGKPEDVYLFTASVEDALSNTVLVSPTHAFMLDTTPPAIPTFTDVTLEGDTGIKLEGVTEYRSQLLVEFWQGNTLVQTLDAVTKSTSSKDVPWSHTWSASLPAGLPHGTYEIVLKATDTAGNVTHSPQDSYSIVVSAQGVQYRPFVQSEDQIALNDATPVEHSLIVNTTASEVIATDQAMPMINTVTAEAVESSTVSTAAIFNTATASTLPTPIFQGVDFMLNGVSMHTVAGSATNDATPTLSGTTGAPGATLLIKLSREGQPEKQVFSTEVNPDGSWSLTLPTLEDGQWKAIISQQYTAGDSNYIYPVSFVVDTVAPEPMTALLLDGVSYATDSAAQLPATTQQTPTLSGKGEAGATITINLYQDNARSEMQTMTTKVGADGSWSQTLPVLEDGQWTTAISIKDAVGNSNSQVHVQSFVVDTTAPELDTDLLLDGMRYATSITLGNTITPSSALPTTTQKTPTLSGTGEAGAIITIKFYQHHAQADAQTLSTKVLADGSWSQTLPALTDGKWTTQISIEDALGNNNKQIHMQSFVVDTTTPAPITEPSMTDDQAMQLLDTASVSILETPDANLNITLEEVLVVAEAPLLAADGAAEGTADAASLIVNHEAILEQFVSDTSAMATVVTVGNTASPDVEPVVTNSNLLPVLEETSIV